MSGDASDTTRMHNTPQISISTAERIYRVITAVFAGFSAALAFLFAYYALKDPHWTLVYSTAVMVLVAGWFVWANRRGLNIE